jgi:hypothetical protein
MAGPNKLIGEDGSTTTTLQIHRTILKIKWPEATATDELISNYKQGRLVCWIMM